jgi:zinc protease
MALTDLSVALSPESVRRTLLPNGLTVLVRRDASAPVVAIVTYVRAGYFDETDDVLGIAHVLEHMFFKGTPDRAVGEIARETKSVGGYLNAATIYDHTVYYTVLPSSGFATGLDVQFDAYANSLIEADELSRELEVIIQEAMRKEDNPGAVITETLYELLHDRHRIRRWRIGREAGLRALTREAMLKFYRNFYHPGNTVLTIVGDVDPDDAIRKVTERYGALPSGTPVLSPGPTEEGVGGFRYRECAPRPRSTTRRPGWTSLPLCSVVGGRHGYTAPCARKSSLPPSPLTITRPRHSACSSCTPKRRQSAPPTRRAPSGRSCARFASRE